MSPRPYQASHPPGREWIRAVVSTYSDLQLRISVIAQGLRSNPGDGNDSTAYLFNMLVHHASIGHFKPSRSYLSQLGTYTPYAVSVVASLPLRRLLLGALPGLGLASFVLA